MIQKHPYKHVFVHMQCFDETLPWNSKQKPGFVETRSSTLRDSYCWTCKKDISLVTNHFRVQIRRQLPAWVERLGSEAWGKLNR
jgi:hypothetical protein